MLFTEASFLLLFLPTLLLAYFAAPVAVRNALLLATSLLFYAWGEGHYAAVMVGSIAMNWAFGLAVGRTEGRSRRGWLAAAVAANLGLLGYFKYANFAASSLARVLGAIGLDASWAELGPIHLPIGISFFTFQAMSYVIDVARREVEAERNPLRVGLYIALFPQLIAGPIVRYVDVAAAIRRRVVTLDGFAEGVRRFVLGLAKKMLIANQLAVVADLAFGQPAGDLSASMAWLGAVCYMGQIYFDFSGYSDMAIGLGRMFGFRFLENFDFPYIATSVTEFWRRWHISLSTWFRDYLYIPLGGNRLGPSRTYFNLMTVFFLCGLWHGASWTFVAWGLYHGFFLVIERRLGLGKVGTPARHAYLLLVVLIGWVFFRAGSIRHAIAYLGAMAGLGAGTSALGPELYLHGEFLLVLAAAVIFSTPAPGSWLRRLGLWPPLVPEAGGRAVPAGAFAGAFSTVGVMALLLLSMMEIAEQSYNPFIYFRF